MWMKADGHTGKAIAKYLGVSRATLYRYLADEAA
jgi:AcrR family transcriptional regulator